MNTDNLHICDCGIYLDKSICQKCPVCGKSTTFHDGLSKYTKEEKLARKEFFRKRYYEDMGLEYKPLRESK